MDRRSFLATSATVALLPLADSPVIAAAAATRGSGDAKLNALFESIFQERVRTSPTLASSLKSGHSFRQGLQAVADEGQPPISKELVRVLAEARLGRPLDEALADMTARVGSSLNFDKRFSWGAINIGGTRYQDLSSDNITQTFPSISLTPSAVNLTEWMTWSPQFSFTNDQTFHQASGTLLVPNANPSDTLGLPDTLKLFNDSRRTVMTINTPLRLGRWNWSNNLTITDSRSQGRQEFQSQDTTGAIRRVLYGQTFETRVEWQTGINLPSFFASTWKLQPGVAIVNATGAGPFMIRNQFTDGEYVQQGKRLQFFASISPTFFAFFPGLGPFSRIRHSISPQIRWQYAPSVQVPERFAHAIDPTGRTLNARSDPQQTIEFGFSQNFEAKLKPAAGDTASESEPRKIHLLSISTTGFSYNFEQAKQPHRTGWQTPSMTNTFLSDLIPGFQLSISHDLWKGQVGTDSAKFSPFLSAVSASFTVTPATLQGIGRLLGLRPRPSKPSAPDTTGQGPELAAGSTVYAGNTALPVTPALGIGGRMGRGFGGGRGFNLSISLSTTRSRGDTTPQLRNTPGRRTAMMQLSFSPTRNWTANWGTRYDFATGQFADHSLTFQRDLRRWRASFSFVKTAAGNFSFSFNITLTDQPDIKFDYDQNTYVR